MSHCKGHIAHCLGRILAVRHGDAVTIFGDRRLSGAEFVRHVRQLASGLAKRGVAVGDVVAIAAMNSDLYIQLLLAITYLGAIPATLNHRWSIEEARSAINLVQPKALAFDESCSSWVVNMWKTSSSIELYILLGDPSHGIPGTENFLYINSLEQICDESGVGDTLWAPNDVALICFTSGTTGKPKGVAISHTSLIIQSLAKIAIVGYDKNDVYLHNAPLCHIGGISSCLVILMAGGCHVLLRKFDVKSAFMAIREHQVTCFITVPAIMADFVSYARKTRFNGGFTVTKILNGGGVLSDEIIDEACRIFSRATIMSAYGMTETCSSLTFMTLTNLNHRKSGDRQTSEIIKSRPCYNQPLGFVLASQHLTLRYKYREITVVRLLQLARY